jgi:probable HAF family extracellular repeat protein
MTRAVVTIFLLLAAWSGFRDQAMAAVIAYQVTDLGTLGGSFSQGQDINAAGQVTGESYRTGDIPHHAFRWTPTIRNGDVGTMVDLGTLGGSFSVGYGINAIGHVSGQSDMTGDTAFSAFLYDGTMHDLGTLGGTSSSAADINNADHVVGYSNLTGDATYHAFLYDGTMHDLGTLGGSPSSAAAINSSGQIVGLSYTTGNAAQHAFRYDGTMHDLGTLGGTTSSAAGINDSGQITGDATLVNGTSRAFLYDGTMHNLGTLGGASSSGLDINSSGHVVGTSLTAGGATHGFVYTSSDGMLDLTSLVSGWVIESAKGINDAGQITGLGVRNGESHAVLLTPVPEPSTFALLVLGAAVASLRRR